MDKYKADFPNIQNIVPIKDPDKVDELDGNLLRAFRDRGANLTLAIPDIIDYRDFTCCMFAGRRNLPSEIYPDISIEQFYDYLDSGPDLPAIGIEELKIFRLMLTDADGNPGASYSMYRSLLFETSIVGDGSSYHLCEGGWYKVEGNYVQKLKGYLDSKCEDSDLCPYNHDDVQGEKRTYSEGNYNTAIPAWRNEFICLDQTDISPSGNTAIEPCDLYSLSPGGDRAVLYHLKISTRSSQLSHLFNQGVNSLELISLEQEARQKFKQLIKNDLHGNDEGVYLAPVDAGSYKVVFAIITHKDKGARSDNLPLFSKISLRRNLQRLDLMKAQSALMFVEDRSPAKGGFSKYKKVVIQVYQVIGGKMVARPVVGQGLDVNIEISRIPKEVKESAVGSRFRMHVKENPDGELVTNRNWPVEKI